jgi:hypothetical protein
MSRKIRERAENKKFLALLTKHGVKLADSSAGAVYAFYDDVVEHFEPMVERTTTERLSEILAAMSQTLREKYQEGAEVKLDVLMQDHGLDPAIRSDRARTQKFLKDSGLVQIIKAKPQTMVVKALTNGKTEASEEAPV